MATTINGLGTVIGVLVGAAASPLCTFALDWIGQRRQRKLNRVRKDRLRKILLITDRPWRDIAYLAKAVAASEITTQRLLLEIDARPAFTRSSTKWALISRKPFPTDLDIERDADDEPPN